MLKPAAMVLSVLLVAGGSASGGLAWAEADVDVSARAHFDTGLWPSRGARGGLKAGWDQASVWLAPYQELALPGGRYRTRPGYEVGVAGFDRRQRLTLTGFTSEADFNHTPDPAVEDIRLYGWSLSVSEPVALSRRLTFNYGVGFSSGLLIWDYPDPAEVADEPVRTDSLLFYGVVVPLSVGTHWGPVWLEAAATPTLRLSSGRTRAGLRNELTLVQATLPLSLRLGVLF